MTSPVTISILVESKQFTLMSVLGLTLGPQPIPILHYPFPNFYCQSSGKMESKMMAGASVGARASVVILAIPSPYLTFWGYLYSHNI